jgi:hypothetical protein
MTETISISKGQSIEFKSLCGWKKEIVFSIRRGTNGNFQFKTNETGSDAASMLSGYRGFDMKWLQANRDLWR